MLYLRSFRKQAPGFARHPTQCGQVRMNVMSAATRAPVFNMPPHRRGDASAA